MKKSFAGILSTALILWWFTVRQCSRLFYRVGNLIISAILFYAVFAPLGAIQRLVGRDELRLRLDAKAQTYWIEHQPLGLFPRTILLVEIVAFLKKRRKLWLTPIITLMMLLRIIVRKVSTTKTSSRLIYPLH